MDNKIKLLGFQKEYKMLTTKFKKEHPELKVKFEYYDLPDWILKFKNKIFQKWKRIDKSIFYRPQ